MELLQNCFNAVNPDIIEQDNLPQPPMEVYPYQLISMKEDGSETRYFRNPCDLPPRSESMLYTLVLDLDETLTTARTPDSSLVIRPGARRLLERMARLRVPVVPGGEHQRAVEIILWSAGEHHHVKYCVDLLDPNRTLFDYIIYRSTEWFPGSSHSLMACKNLSLLPGRADTSIIIDDCPSAAVLSGNRALITPPFDSGTPGDMTLFFVLQITMFLAIILAVDRMERSRTSYIIPGIITSSRSHDFTDVIECGARVLRALNLMPPTDAEHLGITVSSSHTSEYASPPYIREEDITQGNSIAFAMVAAKVLKNGVDHQIYNYDRTQLIHILQCHPFVAKSFIDLPSNSSVEGWVLDVNEPSRLGERLQTFYQTYATATIASWLRGCIPHHPQQLLSLPFEFGFTEITPFAVW